MAAAANLVSLEAVSLAYGVRPILSDVSLGLQQGDRIGVVGRNGDGKTSLLEVLAGVRPPDTGRVARNRGLRVGLLGQRDAFADEATVRHVVVGDRADHEWAADRRSRAVVESLLPGVALDRPVAGLSGGERRRVSLAALLLADLDVLLLDEPTNHLDIDGVSWLAEHLASRGEAIVVVTHDRWFLDEVCTQTWEVHEAQVDQYDGGYAAYVLAKAERMRQARASEQRRQNLVRKELAWLRRGAPARTSKPRFRLDAAAALIADEPPPRDRLELQRFASARLGKDVLDLEDASISKGGRTLVDRLTWRLGPGDRVGLVGANGSGKSSVLAALAGEERPTAGRLRTGRTVRLAHLEQDLAGLPTHARVLESVEAVRRIAPVGRRELSATVLLESFGFTGDRLTARVGDLSGGERRRLQLLRLLLDEPNVLLLDEPTNDLDIETLTVVEDFLDGWVGTLVVVSHDRYFLERVCDETWALLGDGSLLHLPGGVDEYVRRRRAPRAAERSGVEPVHAVETASGGADGATDAVAKGAAGGAAAARAAKKELARLDRQLDKLNARIEAVHERMAAHASDHVRLQELDEELARLNADREQVEAAWLAAAEQG